MLSSNSVLWFWRRIYVKKIPTQAKQTSPKWLNSPVKVLETCQFRSSDFFLYCWSCLWKVLILITKSSKKAKKNNNYFLQRTIILSVMMLSGSLYKQLWYLHHCLYHNLIAVWIKEPSRQTVFSFKPSTATCSHCQAWAAESKVGIGLLKGKNKGSHHPLTILMFPSTCLRRVVPCGLLNSYCACVSEQPRKTLEMPAYTKLKHVDKKSSFPPSCKAWRVSFFWMLILQQISSRSPVPALSVHLTKLFIRNLFQQNQGWHRPYSSWAQGLRTTKRIAVRRTEVLSNDPEKEIWLEIKFTCNAYLALLVTRMAEHVFGVPLLAYKKMSALLNLPCTDSSLIFCIRGHWHCEQYKLFLKVLGLLMF